MLQRVSIILMVGLASLICKGADPMATHYSWSDCQGTYKLYPAPDIEAQYPDTLTPLMINHVGRHGARYPSSAKRSGNLRLALEKIEANGGLSPTGKRLREITDRVIEASSGRWGALSALGRMEQCGIAARMVKAYRPLFKNGKVYAISSYSPRCIMSMYEFVHQLSRLDNNIEVTTTSGRNNSSLMRFFDGNVSFDEFLHSEALEETLSGFAKDRIPIEPFNRLVAKPVEGAFDEDEMRQTVSDAFNVLTGLECIGFSCNSSMFFNEQESNMLWSVNNMEHYLRRSASTLSTVPVDISAPLLDNLVSTFDRFLANPESVAPVQLRFGHAETLMPLLALMKLDGCYYVTNYFDTVGLHWCDFHVVPMASNLQLILFRSKKGNLYLKAELNEQDVPLIPGQNRIYVPWKEAREYLLNCLPFDYFR